MTPLVLPWLGVAFAAPWGLAAGAAAAAALVALHAITVGRPRPSWLPTARFAPERPPRAARQSRRPRDLAVLAARVLAALAAGAALARPVAIPERRAVRRLVLADRSRAAAAAPVRAAVLAAARPGDVVLPFAAAPGSPVVLAAPADDPAALAQAVDAALAGAADTARADAGRADAGRADAGRAGSLSAALVAARRLAPTLAAGADSLELVLVTPVAAEEVDAATALVRAAWAGRARVARVAGRPADPAGASAGRGARAVALRGAPPDDALAAALALAAVPAGGDEAPVRVARAGATDADRAWARGAGRVLVDWPADGRPAGARASAAADTAQALVVEGVGVGSGAVAVAPFARRAALDAPPAGGAGAVAERVVARWADGRVAAVERAEGGGCVRRVAVAVPQAGDAALRRGFRDVLPALVGRCGGNVDLAPASASTVAMLMGRGPLLAAAPLRAELAPPAPDRPGAALLAVAILALLAELGLRRRAAESSADLPAESEPAVGGVLAGPAAPRPAARPRAA